MKCAEYLSLRNTTKEKATYIEQISYSWIQGFMTAMDATKILNGGEQVDLDGLDSQYQRQIILDFCKKNQQASLLEAAQHLFNTLENSQAMMNKMLGK